jgi:formylmethanofuran dehydrogenase subunit E
MISRSVFMPLVLLAVGLPTAADQPEEPVLRLLQPHYQRLASDPQWLVEVARFHGHLGPAVVVGARLGMAALRAVGAEGYFDVEVTCEGPFAKPPQSCFLDGIQIATGATLGKRTLHYVEGKQMIVRAKNTQTGKMAEIRPAPALLQLLSTLKPPATAAEAPGGAGPHEGDQPRLEQVSRQIAVMPEKEVLTVTSVK